jgi:hypothetical protein
MNLERELSGACAHSSPLGWREPHLVLERALEGGLRLVPASSATALVDSSDLLSALAATVMRMSVSRSLAERPSRS